MNEQTNNPIGNVTLEFRHTEMDYENRTVIYWYHTTLGAWYGMRYTGLPPDDEGVHRCQVQMLDVDSYPIDFIEHTSMFQQMRADSQLRIITGLEHKMQELINHQDLLIESLDVVGEEWIS